MKGSIATVTEVEDICDVLYRKGESLSSDIDKIRWFANKKPVRIRRPRSC